ncbi:hypothetical protein TcYC6_0028700 [Trypanosoma cruzi]|nr:hypothetical protein TcYC6_0028700 [Trypanosoma cruzi]
MDHHHHHFDVKLPEAVGILGPNGEVIPLDDPRAKRFEPPMVCKCPPQQYPLPVAEVVPTVDVEPPDTEVTANNKRNI